VKALISNVVIGCNCNGHADECVYDVYVEHYGLSRDTKGSFNGGGRCLNCKVKIFNQ